MTYKKINNYSYNLHIIKTKKFKTVTIQVGFKRKLTKRAITYRNMIVNMLCESNKFYPTKRDLIIKTEELYDLYYRGMNYISGRYNIMNFSINFLNEKYTEKGYLEESVKFLSDLIFNPNIEEDKFKEENFRLSYNILKENILSQKENPDSYSRMRMLEVMEPNSMISYRSCGYLSDLENINNRELYDYYKSILEKDIVDIFVIGDVNEVEIEKIIKDKFSYINTIKKPSESHFLLPEKRKRICNKVVEKQKINQSKLCLGYKIDKMSDFEFRYVLNVYSYILGGGPDSKLFKTVREKNSLCYYISSTGVALNSILTIKAGINKKSFKKCLSLIKKEVSNMKKGNFNNDDIMKAKITYMNSMKELEDDPNSIISLYAGMEYLNGEEIKSRIEKINRVTKKDVIKLAKKIHLDTVYLLEGEDND